MTIHLGLDLGGTNIKAAVVEVGGDGSVEPASGATSADPSRSDPTPIPTAADPRVLATSSVPTRSDRGPEAVIEAVIKLGREVVEPFGPPDSAGLGLPGHFDADTGCATLLPNLAGDWVGRSIAAPVSDGLGLPVALLNDVRALTYGELRLGAGRGARDVFCIAIGTGVGGGVIIDGRLHLGLGHAGEVGHTTVDPDGPLCGCGNRGCLDRVAGADAIAADAGHATVQEAIAAAAEGDGHARTAFERAGRIIGQVVANVVVLLWPERVIVGGGVAEAGDLLLEPIRAEVARRACVAPVDRIPVVRAELGTPAGAIGAALWSTAG